MKLSNILILGVFLSLILSSQLAEAQCKSWVGSPQEEEGTNAHSIYRQALKSEDFTLALEQWQIAYDIAPAADGKRDYHLTDGIKLYLNLIKDEKDAAKLKEYKAKVNGFYDEAIECYKSGAIVTKSCNTPEGIKKKTGYLRGRQAYDMFYNLRTPYSENLEVLKAAVENSGDETEYIVMTPYAEVLVALFQKGKVKKEIVVKAYEQLNKICDVNIAKDDRLSPSYKQAKDAMNGSFLKIEKEIFDCNYFVKKFKPKYEANPNDIDQLKLVIAKLKIQGCDGSSDPFIAKLEGQYKAYAQKHNAEAKATFEANNPATMAKKMYDGGDFNGAINKYKEAIQKATDNNAKAKYQKIIASILFRKLGKYGEARRSAKKAASLRPGWGAPYILIGDMYGKSARSCGDSWNQRLAILAAIDKYKYAKSIDGSVAGEANKRISTYSRSLPSKEDVFQRGLKNGQSAKVGCWIAETVKIRTQ